MSDPESNTQPQLSALQQKVKFARRVTLISFALLLIGLTGSVFSGNTSPKLLIPALLPLLIFLPGILKSQPSSLILLCFVSLLYFCVITVNVFESDRSIYDILALVSVVVLFVVAMFFSRWQKALNYQEDK
ncbi:MAG: DUF2069 domain-containing protein [Porticoccaceae bacterium]|nr:DUF2069 domain-containing protein [Porticoccaceae bacterium]